MRQYSVRSSADMGRAIAEARLALGLDQTEAGKLTGLSKSYVSKIESGRTSSLFEHQLRMLRRLGATITVEFDDKAS